jgi:hypothetical protein
MVRIAEILGRPVPFFTDPYVIADKGAFSCRASPHSRDVGAFERKLMSADHRFRRLLGEPGAHFGNWPRREEWTSHWKTSPGRCWRSTVISTSPRARRPEPSVRQRLEVLHLLWEETIQDGLVRHNPVTGALLRETKPRVKEKVQKRVALSIAEGMKLVNAATEDELVAIVIRLDTGDGWNSTAFGANRLATSDAGSQEGARYPVVFRQCPQPGGPTGMADEEAIRKIWSAGSHPVH